MTRGFDSDFGGGADEYLYCCVLRVWVHLVWPKSAKIAKLPCLHKR